MTKKLRLLFFALLVLPLFSFAKYDYTLRWDKPNTHTYWIEMETTPQTEGYTDVQIATWRPGRYIAQEYASAITGFVAKDGKGNTLKFNKTSKNTWRIQHGKTDKVKIKYAYYANNEDAGSSYYTEGQAYFNPINCFMYVPGKLDEAVTLNVPDLPKEWEIATALTPTRDFHIFTAASFHEFADCPTVFADKMKKMMFRVGDVTFFLHFQGDYKGDASVDSAIVQNMRKVVSEQGAIFGGFPFKTFHFIYRLLDYDLRHAVEHGNSTSVVVPSKTTAAAANVVGGIVGISSHEFFHAWNVKRIRPAALFPYNYNQEQYTGLHWFTEGVTDYYSTLVMIRSGVISEEKGLSILAAGMQSIDANYAYSVVSPYYSSYDSWLSPSGYAHPLLRNSFYTLGQRLGAVIDLKIRTMTGGKKSFDDVFTYLYKEYYIKNLGVPEDGIQKAMEFVSGASWQDFFDKYVYGTEKMNYNQLLAGTGMIMDIKENEATTLEKLGIQQFEKGKEGWFIKKIHPAGEAYQAGVGLNDLIIAINDQKVEALDDAKFFASLKKGDVVKVDFINAEGSLHSEKITYSGETNPKIYTLKRGENLNAMEGKIIADWLQTKVK
jgi:predicted metalloprotease with PDZ domain